MLAQVYCPVARRRSQEGGKRWHLLRQLGDCGQSDNWSSTGGECQLCRKSVICEAPRDAIPCQRPQRCRLQQCERHRQCSCKTTTDDLGGRGLPHWVGCESRTDVVREGAFFQVVHEGGVDHFLHYLWYDAQERHGSVVFHRWAGLHFMDGHDVCCFPQRRIDTLPEAGRKQAGQGWGQFSCTDLQHPRRNAVGAGSLRRVKLPKQPCNGGWAEAHMAQGSSAPVWKGREVGSLEVIPKAALRGEKSAKTLGLVFVGCVLPSLVVSYHWDTALTTVPTSCFQRWPPLLILHWPLLKAASNSVDFAFSGVAKADSTLSGKSFVHVFVRFWWVLLKSVPWFLFCTDSACALWSPPTWIWGSC